MIKDELFQIIDDLIKDYDADIEGCGGNELIEYGGAIKGLDILKKRINKKLEENKHTAKELPVLKRDELREFSILARKALKRNKEATI